MKRPMLISGITTAIVSAFLMTFLKNGAFVVLLTGALAFILYLIKPLKLRKYIIIPVVCLSSVLICVSFLAYTHFKIEPCLKYDSETAYLSGKIVTTPTATYDGKLTFVLETEKIGKSDEKLKVDVTIPHNKEESPLLYDYISIQSAHFSVFRDEYNNPDLSYAADGIMLYAEGSSVKILWKCEKTPYYYCLRFKELVNERIDGFMWEEAGAILKGLIFGGSKNIPQKITTAFKNSGISHLLAVSGLHTSLWCGLLIFILNLFKVPPKIRNSLCIVFLSLFCIVTAFSPSVLRSSLMMLLVLTAPFFKTVPDSFNSLGFAVTVLLLSNPYIIFSLSFQLSLTATIGVLIASYFEIRLKNILSKIKLKPARSFISYIVCSVLLSAFAGLFTMPVSAYNFGVVSFAAPITNILCVKPAFYAMILGSTATAVSYINLPFIRKVAFFLYDITDFLLTSVADISQTISDFRYCTLPVHKIWLINGLFCTIVLILTGYLIFKIRKNSLSVKITAVIAVLLLFINIFIPLLPTPYSDTLTVVSHGNNMHIIMRSGTKYAYITNSAEQYPTDAYNYLPKATCESLDYYIATYLTYTSCKDLERTNDSFNTLETHITPEIHNICVTNNIALPQNTFISASGNYVLNNKINIDNRQFKNGL